MGRPFAIYHEHPLWFRPLFAELDRRGLPYVRLDCRAHLYDPAELESPYALVFNRMSPSAYLRDGVQGIFFTLGYLAHLERLEVPVVNGLTAFTYETSKARQLTLLESLDLPYPLARVINHPSRAVEAAQGLRYPVMVKANVGGSGAGIARFDSPAELAAAVAENRLDFGVDHTALVQEFIPARGGHICRVETLGGKALYGIKVYAPQDQYNLCPGSICQRADGAELTPTTCPAGAAKTGLKVEAFAPPPQVVETVELIARTAGIDVGGIEYMIDDRDGRLVFYDINALSNFVAEPMSVIGFDPFVKLVDYLEERAVSSQLSALS